jgi:hypothetical protein
MAMAAAQARDEAPDLKASVQDAEALMPADDKYFSDEEKRALIRFRATSLAQKAGRLRPVIAAEWQPTREITTTAGRQAMFEVLAENPDLAAALAKARRESKGASAATEQR